MYKSNRLSIYKDHVYVDPKRSHTDENAASTLYDSIRICMHVFMFICMYVCIHVYTYIYLNVYVWLGAGSVWARSNSPARPGRGGGHCPVRSPAITKKRVARLVKQLPSL